MSQSENKESKLQEILNKVKTGVQKRVGKRVSAVPEAPQPTENVEVPPPKEDNPELLMVREYLADVKEGKFDPKKHPLWEMNLIN